LKKSIHSALKVFELYSAGSGAKINTEKTEIMCLGKSSLSDEVIAKFHVNSCKTVVKILGVFLGKDEKECQFLTWHDKVIKI